jgi:hypothetical protein
LVLLEATLDAIPRYLSHVVVVADHADVPSSCMRIKATTMPAVASPAADVASFPASPDAASS